MYRNLDKFFQIIEVLLAVYYFYYALAMNTCIGRENEQKLCSKLHSTSLWQKPRVTLRSSIRNSFGKKYESCPAGRSTSKTT